MGWGASLLADNTATPDYSLYHAHYHDEKAAASRRAADVILPIVFSVIDVRSVLDVGCGYGDWLAAARELGVGDLTGVEGPWASAWRDRDVLATQFELRLADLEAPLRSERTYDLVLCIEVAEHLTSRRGASFVADLCAAGDAVLLGAAIPGQHGPNHVHEQWTSEWAQLFARHGYRAVDCIRPRIWTNRSLWAHHRQNPVLYVAETRFAAVRARALALPDPEAGALDVIHPDFYLRELEGRSTALSLREHLRLLTQIPRAAVRSLDHRVNALRKGGS
jgi:SAM-dependent methyltransferase